jgi:zinc/manganese transport system substrate-binding protein
LKFIRQDTKSAKESTIMKRLVSILILSLCGYTAPTTADLRAFTCEPEWKALLDALGDGEVDSISATTALQDPHHIEARPSLIARMGRADLVVCTGAGLESGWLPQLQRSSGNAKVQPGQPGYFEAASAVKLLEVPTRVDRAEGDVHPEGNPHLHLDPRNIALVATALSARLAVLDPRHADRYQKAHVQFAQRWQQAMARWEREVAPLKGMPVVYHHRSWVYLQNWLGLKEAGLLEPKPGLPPSAAHLAQLLEQLKQKPARAVVRAAYEDGRADDWLAEHASIPALILPYTVGTEGADDLVKLFDVTIAKLKGAMK